MGNKARRLVSLVLVVGLFFQQAGFVQAAGALSLAGYLNLPGSSALSQDRFRPVQMRYFSYEPVSDNFKILLDKGDLNKLEDKKAKEEAQALLSYFLVGVALPDDTFWVNLRPDSQDQIIDPLLEKTEVGRIMLEADLQLKQDISRMTSPQTPEGKAYWDKLYQKAEELYGHSPAQIPTITRPWIVPGEIIVRESQNSAYVYKAGLKVMLEEDYLSRGGFEPAPTSGGSRTAPTHQQYAFSDPRLKELNQYSTQLIKELIIPKLTKEINSSKRYANLRQVYYSLILSRWFKLRFTGKSGSYASLINTGNLANLTSNRLWDKGEYFNQYQQSFAKGEYNLKEQVYIPTGQSVRSYVSGGVNWASSAINTQNGAILPNDNASKLGKVISGKAVVDFKKVILESLTDYSSEKAVSSSMIINNSRDDLVSVIIGDLTEEKEHGDIFSLVDNLIKKNDIPRLRYLLQQAKVTSGTLVYEGSYSDTDPFTGLIVGIISKYNGQPSFDHIFKIIFRVAYRLRRVDIIDMTIERLKQIIEESYAELRESDDYMRKELAPAINKIIRGEISKIEEYKRHITSSSILQTSVMGSLVQGRVKNKLEELKNNSGLPILTTLDNVSEKVTDNNNALWAQTLRAFHFSKPVYRRVEKEGDKEERYTGQLAFTNADADADIKQLTVYDVSLYSNGIRKGEDVRGFILNPDAEIPPEAYFMHRGIFASKADIQKAFYDNKIRFDITVIPPAIWGVDFAKTVGHYHNPVEKPEIYQVVSGEVLWLLQKSDKEGNVVDFITVRAKAGDIAIMLPGYGHVSVNLSETEPLVMADWLTWHQSSYYGSFKEKRGAAYYVIKNDQGYPELIPNKEYLTETQKVLPPPRQMVSKDKIPAFGLERGVPIYNIVKLGDQEFKQKVEFLNKPQQFPNILTLEATLDDAKPQEKIKISVNSAADFKGFLIKEINAFWQGLINFEKEETRAEGYFGYIPSMFDIEEGYFRDTILDSLLNVAHNEQEIRVGLKLIFNRVIKKPAGGPVAGDHHIGYLHQGSIDTSKAIALAKDIDSLRRLINSSLAESGEGKFDSVSSSMQSLPDKKTGGIDFRGLPMTIQPMGSFRGLDFGLPRLSRAEIEQINIESQIGQIKNMVSSGISPSGRRVKELVAACAQKGQISAYADDLLACIGDILKLEEEIAKESSPELKEALVLADLGGNYFQL